MSEVDRNEIRPKEAMLYRALEEERVQCYLCAHRCKISNGKRGIWEMLAFWHQSHRELQPTVATE